jgi:hypothetical protein
MNLFVPAPGSVVQIAGPDLARAVMAAGAMMASVASHVSGLRAHCERLAAHAHLDVQISSDPRRVHLPGCRGLHDVSSCPAHASIMITLPDHEGVAGFLQSAGLTANARLGVLRDRLLIGDLQTLLA